MASGEMKNSSLADETRLKYLASGQFRKDPRNTVLRTWEEQVDPKHTALLIVDVQNDFVHPERSLYNPDGLGRQGKGELWKAFPIIPRMLQNLPRLLQSARQANLFIVFIQAIYDSKYISEPLAFVYERMGLYGDICVSGTPGADFYGDIRPIDSPREVVVNKHRFSAFWDTDLDLILRSNGIKTVVMTGVATSGCVESTTRDAFFNDYYTVTVGDCCAEASEEFHNNSLAIIGTTFGLVVNCDDLIGIWQKVGRTAAV